jgi:hypothetical protein
MQLASSGLRGATRNTSHFIPRAPRGVNVSGRNIHVVSRVKPSQSTAQKLVAQTRALLGQFFTQLTAPGLQARGSYAPSFARSLHGGANGGATIQSRLSFATRTTLSRPLHYFPKAPAAKAFGPTNVGLGTARNFSSGRMLFQNIADNVPIATRAFFEADWDIKQDEGKKGLRLRRKVAAKKSKSKKAQKENIISFDRAQNQPAEKEMDKYFSAAEKAQVITQLLIPLAPSTSRSTAIVGGAFDPGPLLPVPDIARINRDHELHSLRVSSLFSRLDAANVWDRGVECSAYGSRASPEGVCDILKVEFSGWTKAEVRSVIGESGTGWCALEEMAVAKEDDGYDSEYLSDVSSEMSGTYSSYASSNVDLNASIMPSDTLVLPTLDFSSSFAARANSPVFSDISQMSNDYSKVPSTWSETSSEFEEVDLPATSGWIPGAMNFSSEFIRLTEGSDVVEPREQAF